MAPNEWCTMRLSSKGCYHSEAVHLIDVAVWARTDWPPANIKIDRYPCQFGPDNYIVLCACDIPSVFTGSILCDFHASLIVAFG